MNIERYFKSLTQECETLKDRVRHFVDDAHWPTDGEWKESVLRSMLKRSAPESVTIGRGFVVHRLRCSSQIDVLIYDNSMPILYRDGDLVFVTPSAVRGIVEVKSNTTLATFRTAADKLADNAEFVRSLSADFHIFVGFFSYGLQGAAAQPFLEALQSAARGKEARVIDHVSLGTRKFIRYWSENPNAPGNRLGYNQWHLYNLNLMAPGYFIHNLLLKVSKKLNAQREDAWFPEQSKEVHIEGQLAFGGAAQQHAPAPRPRLARARRGRA